MTIKRIWWIYLSNFVCEHNMFVVEISKIKCVDQRKNSLISPDEWHRSWRLSSENGQSLSDEIQFTRCLRRDEESSLKFLFSLAFKKRQQLLQLEQQINETQWDSIITMRVIPKRSFESLTASKSLEHHRIMLLVCLESMVTVFLSTAWKADTEQQVDKCDTSSTSMPTSENDLHSRVRLVSPSDRQRTWRKQSQELHNQRAAVLQNYNMWPGRFLSIKLMVKVWGLNSNWKTVRQTGRKWHAPPVVT